MIVKGRIGRVKGDMMRRCFAMRRGRENEKIGVPGSWASGLDEAMERG